MTDFLLPVSISMGLLTYSLIARWYVVPWMDGRSRVEALTPILLLHGLRYVGLAFLIPGVTAAPLNPEFAIPAASGDLIGEYESPGRGVCHFFSRFAPDNQTIASPQQDGVLLWNPVTGEQPLAHAQYRRQDS